MKAGRTSRDEGRRGARASRGPVAAGQPGAAPAVSCPEAPAGQSFDGLKNTARAGRLAVVVAEKI